MNYGLKINKGIKILCIKFLFLGIWIIPGVLLSQNLQLVSTIDSLKKYCSSEKISFSIQATIQPNPGNFFIFELSDSAGNFIQPQKIDSVGTQGFHDIELPEVQYTSGQYRVRLISTSPVDSSGPSKPIYIKQDPRYGLFFLKPNALCKGDTTIVTDLNDPLGIGYKWYKNRQGLPHGTPVLRISEGAEYRLEITQEDCKTTSEEFLVQDIDTRILGFDSTYCENDSPFTVGVTPGGGMLQGLPSSRVFNPQDSTPGTYTIAYTEPFVRYKMREVPTFWRNFVGTQLALDEVVDTIVLPFSMPFFDNQFDTLFVSPYGIVSFKSIGQACCNGQPIPNYNYNNGKSKEDNYIALWWGNLTVLHGGTIKYTITGLPGNQIFTLAYENIPLDHALNSTSDFQLVLFEETGIIEIQLFNCKAEGKLFSTGIERDDGDFGYQYYLGKANVSEKAIQFVPSEGCTCEQQTTINRLPEVGFTDSILTTCVTAPPFELTQGWPSPGRYLGIGVERDSLYNPSLLGQAGWDTIQYEYQSPQTGCFNSSVAIIEVLDRPLAAFEVMDTCFGDTLRTINVSSTHSMLDTMTWLGGEQYVENQFEPFFRADSAGPLDIKLTLKSLYGCQDTFARKVEIKPLPAPVWATVRDIPTLGDSTFFQNLTPNLKNSIWEFPDSSLLQDPIHFFPDSGWHTFSLFVCDTFGCQNKTAEKVYIRWRPDKLTVYPNPTSDELFATVLLARPNDIKLVLINELGQEVYKKQYLNEPEGIRLLSINLTSLSIPEGFYFLSVIVGGKKINFEETEDRFVETKKPQIRYRKIVYKP